MNASALQVREGDPQWASDATLDSVVVGAGPGGLTAALYLARYRRRVLVVHDGTSRALRIPLSHNVPAFPGGVRGRTLIARMLRQAEFYGAAIRKLQVQRVEKVEDGFVVHTGGGVLRARTVIIATGINLHQIDLPHRQHEAAIRRGILRYCPICDGYEASGRRVGVIGASAHGAAEALFLRQYTDRIALMAVRDVDLTKADRKQLESSGIEVIASPVKHYEAGSSTFAVRFEDGARREFDIVYPALGCTPRTALLSPLTLESDEGGALVIDKDQSVGIEGLYIAGDVAEAMDQVSVAIGHGAVAATQAHNHLRVAEQRVLRR